MKSKNTRISSFFKEIAIVVIGVLIAVSINNFKDKLDNKQYIKKTLTAIEKEIDQNEIEVRNVLMKHRLIIDSLQTSKGNNNESLMKLISRLKGIQSADIKNIGLRYFVSSKAELVDYNIISQLSDIETSTNILNTKMNRLVDFMYEHSIKKDNSTKIEFGYHLSNVINSENELLKLYSNFEN